MKQSQSSNMFFQIQSGMSILPRDVKAILPYLKLPSLFTAWPFWTFHIKSHNMKALVILSHSWSPFLPLTGLYGKNELLWVSALCGLLEYFLEKKTPPRLPMQLTWPWPPVGRFVSWPDYCKTYENVNITLLDLCLFTFYSVHANESTCHWL